MIAAYLGRGRLLRTVGGSAGYVLSSTFTTAEGILMILLGYLPGAVVVAAAPVPSPGVAPSALLSPRALSQYVAG